MKLSKISIDNPKILINHIDISNRPPALILEALLLCINFIYSSEEAIKENLLELFNIAEEYLTEKKSCLKERQEKLECTRILKTIKIWREKLANLNREQITTTYWDFRLRNEKLSLLSGFGFAQIEGNGEGGLKAKRLYGNSEKRTLRSIP